MYSIQKKVRVKKAKRWDRGNKQQDGRHKPNHNIEHLTERKRLSDCIKCCLKRNPF